jgi:hypothetical protein
MKRYLPFIHLMFCMVCIGCCLLSCSAKKTSENNQSADSTAILDLLRDTYKWHAKTGTVDFQLLIKDSFQVGVDTVNLKQSLQALSQTHFFSDEFLNNYERIGRETDAKLKQAKYYNEINFPFQDSDPWTFFQDDAGEYWKDWIITDFKINGDNASLNWSLGGTYPTDKYLVKFKRENNAWKVSYLLGFDIEP